MLNRRASWAALALLALVASVSVNASPAAQVVVADFNSGIKPNNVGGDFGAWTRDPTDPMQGCVESFDAVDRYGSNGYSLRLIYSVDSPKPAFGGLWMRLQDLDASSFDNLAFRVRGDARMGYTNVFKVELKDAMDQPSQYYVRNVGDKWQDVVIPLKAFAGLANPKRLKELVIVFEDTTATAKRGVIYLDDVRFTRNAP